jgi:carbonic anhydrase
MQKLIAGYRRFRKQRWPGERALFHDLSSNGQKPHALVISCCDSRADPATIFDAGPGELFVVRIVSSIVPPYEIGGGYHGTSASIAFGILQLKIGIILVLGHAQCGGVAAALAGPQGERLPFVSDWVDLLAPAVARCPAQGDRHTQTEQEAVKLSMERLLTFPFIAEAVAAGELQIKGAHFGIAKGQLSVLNDETGIFEVVDPG